MRLIHPPLHRRPGRNRSGPGIDRRPSGTPAAPAVSTRLPRRRPVRCTSPGATRPIDSRPATAPTLDASARRRRTARRLLLAAEATAVVLLVSASAAHADTHVLADATAGLDQVKTILDNVRNWVMGILGSIATVFLSVGFVRRIAGASDPEEQGKARAAFKAAAIGYVGVALTPLIITILQGIVGS